MLPAPQGLAGFPRVSLHQRSHAARCGSLAKYAALEFFFEHDIHRLLVFLPQSQVDPACGGRSPVCHHNLIDNPSGEILKCHARVAKEEGPALHGDFADRAPVRIDCPVLDRQSGHFLQKILQHGVAACLEGGGVIDYRIA